MHTIDAQPSKERRRRRLHSDEFKADAVAAAALPGMSMAAVALSRGINANLLRRWVRDAESLEGRSRDRQPKALLAPASDAPAATFVPVQLPPPAVPVNDIRFEVRRGSTTVIVTWPSGLASECGSWLRELLR